MISVAAPRLRAALQCQDSANPCEQSSSAPLCESEHAEGGSVFEYGKKESASVVRRVGLRGSADRREQQSEVWREEVARVAPEPKDRDTFGGVDAPCLVSHSDVFPSLMQGCHWGSDPETGGNGSHGAVHSIPPGRANQSRKQKEASRGEASAKPSEACRSRKLLIFRFIRPICLQPAEQLHGRDAVPRTSEWIAGKSADTHIGRKPSKGRKSQKGAGER